MSEVIVGIDLGTTNSEIAAFHDGQVRVLGNGSSLMLPSCVGLSPQGELLIGTAARNQQMLHPDRTVRSVKRRMGSSDPITLGDRTFSPPEVSALILRELARWAQRQLGAEVHQAVITVPAYFSEAQRQATREAGELAGLQVLRLVNEPTAAGLAYGIAESGSKTVMVYDLGGGTFDVSIVRVEDRVTEVLASHGNTHLGGDDFDQLLVDHLAGIFKEEHGIDLRAGANRGALVRLWTAAEEAKKKLSSEPFATVREEALVTAGGVGRHLEAEISRAEYEDMIRPLIESTLESVSRALLGAGKSPGDIDVVLLVGGSTRTPLVSAVLAERMGQPPRQDVHPDLCVALGAGVLASRSAGHEVDRVLVDVSPYSFGISYVGQKDGEPYPYCYKPIIPRNTPLPITRSEVYYTMYDGQREVEIEIFQGEDGDAMNNTPVGDFMISGLTPMDEPNEVLCRMKLDLSGMLEVTAIEKRTSLSRQVTISGAAGRLAPGEVAASRSRLRDLFENRNAAAGEEPVEPGTLPEEGSALSLAPRGATRDALDPQAMNDPGLAPVLVEAKALLGRCRGLLERLHSDDRIEAVGLNEDLETAIAAGEPQVVSTAIEALREFLFFVEGR